VQYKGPRRPRSIHFLRGVKSTAEVGAHSAGWGRVWGRGRARAAAQTLSGPPGALRGPFFARPRPARPPAGSPGLAPLRGPAAAARRAPGGRGQAVGAGVRAMRGQEIPDRRPRPSAVRHPPRARALHPETCVPDGRMRHRPAALAVSEPLVLRASWGARLGARTYGVRTARLRTFLGAPLACLDTRCGVCATCPFRARLAPQQLPGGSCGAGQWLEKSFEACAAGLPM
jgi:hypothetical protein